MIVLSVVKPAPGLDFPPANPMSALGYFRPSSAGFALWPLLLRAKSRHCASARAYEDMPEIGERSSLRAIAISRSPPLRVATALGS